ncbi:MAG: hypothetical protein R3F49_03700 [Planctomycetota bacterium]
MQLKLSVLGLALAALATSSAAQTLDMIHTGIGSGDIAGVAFSAAPFTITCSGDISNVQFATAGVYFLDHATAAIEVTGVGTFTFVTPTRTFVNQAGPGLVGFSRASAAGYDLFNGPSNSALAGWQLATPVGPLAGTATLLQWDMNDVLTSGGILNIDGTAGVPCTFTAGSGGVGTNFCGPAPLNSAGTSGSVSAQGSPLLAANHLSLRASQLPTGASGYFLASRTQGSTSIPGSQGVLCLAGAIGRFVGPGQVMNSGATGQFTLVLDLTALPTPSGSVPANVGETWNFQAWYRDANPNATSNLTDGVSVTIL